MDEFMIILLSPEIIIGVVLVFRTLITGVIKILVSNK